MTEGATPTRPSHAGFELDETGGVRGGRVIGALAAVCNGSFMGIVDELIEGEFRYLKAPYWQLQCFVSRRGLAVRR